MSQILYENGIFSTYFSGREVPRWFSDKISGSTITFTVPSYPHLNIRVLNLCLVYTLSDVENLLVSPLHVKIQNKNNHLEWEYTPRCYGVPEVQGYIVWLSHWGPEILLEGADEVQVLFEMDVDGQMKECGFHLLYYEEEEEIIQYCNTLSSSWDSKTFGHDVLEGAYLFCHYSYNCYKCKICTRVLVQDFVALN